MEKKNTIRLTESDLKKVISESVKRILGESIELAKNVPPQIQGKYIEKMKREYPDLDPNGFFYMGGTLKHSGKKAPKRPKSEPKEKISKPEDMSIEEYYSKLVLPNNQKIASKENEFADEDWRPVKNIGRYFGGDVDYSSYYEVSNYGRLKVINLKDALKSDIYVGYDAPTRKAMQFHLNGYGADGTSRKTCPDVKYIVADAWLQPMDPKKYMVRHKDGDYHNNTADNLEWVPRRQK